MYDARARALTHFAVWFALAALFYAYSFTFNEPAHSGYAFGSASWPQGVALLVMIAAAVNCLRELKAGEPGAPTENTEDAGRPDQRERLRAAVQMGGIFLIPILYLILIPRIGFYIATPLFLAAELLHLGERRPQRVALIVGGVSLTLCVVFITLFYVAVPVGREGLFYEINTAIVQLFRLD